MSKLLLEGSKARKCAKAMSVAFVLLDLCMHQPNVAKI